MIRTIYISILVSGFLIMLLGGCASTPESPNLATLYNQSSQYHDPWRNPIIVIPGILGTKLVAEDSGQIVWGAFGGTAANPRKPEDARLIALPMQEGSSLGNLRDDVVPDGVLDRIRVKLFGLPIQLDAYVHILSTLGVGGYRDELLGQLGAIDYGDDHYTCFQFDYDWRRDNVENAARLQDFMIQKRAYVRAEVKKRYGVDNPNIKFDVVTHSMGGLLLRYMLRYGDADLPEDGGVATITWDGADLVERAILVSPPNAGSTLTLEQMLEGVRFSRVLPKYPPALLGTFPSLYQLLPRTRHGALISEETGTALDIFDPALWESQGWGLAAPDQDRVLEMLLPDVKDPAERRNIALDHLVKSLDRAHQFQNALDQPAEPPDGLDLYLITGDAVTTGAVVAVGETGGTVSVVDRRAGDGTILRSSALMDERLGGDWTPDLRSPIAWNHVNFVFSDHRRITSDNNFTDNLLYLLLESQR